MHKRAHKDTYIDTPTHTNACTHNTHTQMHIHMHKHTCTFTHMHVRIHTDTDRYKQAWHVYICIYTRTHIVMFDFYISKVIAPMPIILSQLQLVH